jgi:integrase
MNIANKKCYQRVTKALPGVDSPTSHAIVKAVLKGIRRKLGVAQTQKADLSVAQIRALIAATSNDLLGTRDRALVLLGFAAALRRSELVALTVDDLSFEPEGVTLRLQRSKTNQEGACATTISPIAVRYMNTPLIASSLLKPAEKRRIVELTLRAGASVPGSHRACKEKSEVGHAVPFRRLPRPL